jgi:DHA2 family multidrug resistance protein
MMRLGGALMGTWLRVREQVHSNFIGQHLASGSADVTRILKQLSDSFAAHGAASASARALGSLSALVQRESNVLAYIDGFWLTFWIAILALICVIPITRAPPGRFTPVPFDAQALMRAVQIVPAIGASWIAISGYLVCRQG